MFTLVHISTYTFDSDWHLTYLDAYCHALRCGLGSDWHVCELSPEQVRELVTAARHAADLLQHTI